MLFVQKLPRDHACKLVRELRGHVMSCVSDQNGNHVIQKCIAHCIFADNDEEDLIEGQHFILRVCPLTTLSLLMLGWYRVEWVLHAEMY